MTITDTPLNHPFPMWEDGQDSTPTRYLAMPTAASIKLTSLFGIPLRSALTGQELTDGAIETFIVQATSNLEHELNIFITPVYFDERHDYDKEIWTQQYAWQKLNNSPILDVQSVQLAFGNGTPTPPIVDFPLEFVFVNPFDGAIRLVPVLGTASSGFVQSSFAGAQWMSLLAAGIANFPGAMRVKYRAGFEKDKIPALIASLIEKMAALQILSTMGPLLMPFNSVSIGIDGLSQGVGVAGPQFLSSRIADLKEQVQRELDAAKTYYNKRILVDYF
jgi:hypothetical protein